jgi:succinate dehydrogenase/fumarate reductase flavoprotein subunit
MSDAAEFDVIVVGAGHNGLAATALPAARGPRVLCLEKNAHAGGTSGTREILTACRNEVGATPQEARLRGQIVGSGVRSSTDEGCFRTPLAGTPE